jgi:uncharacterized Fe-S radical SAM superfamily protein PflX
MICSNDPICADHQPGNRHRHDSQTMRRMIETTDCAFRLPVVKLGSYFHHTGEELFYRGTQGSGTIFFTSCNMRCAFCQNGDISTDKDNGEETDPRTLATMAWMLREEPTVRIPPNFNRWSTGPCTDLLAEEN